MATTTLVQDSFNRADGAVGTADSGQAWLHTGVREVAVASNACVGEAAGSLQDATYIASGQPDFTLTAKLWLSDVPGIHCGLVWRLTDGDNYYLAFLYYDTGTSYRLYGYKRAAGSWVEMDESPVELTDSPGDWLDCTIITSGTNSKVYLGANLHYDVTDEFNATATGVGVLLDAASQKVDDFLVTWEAPDAPEQPGLSGLSGLSGLTGLSGMA